MPLDLNRSKWRFIQEPVGRELIQDIRNIGPWYAGDGRGSLYLMPSYEVDGQNVLEISNFFVGLNKCDPGPSFHGTEWNGRIILSVDFNELAVEPEIVERWMDLWINLLLDI
ncbi:hypothetical protein Clacol_002277 [Clathrus columnatus]|uniref:Uncharacterized protein n=1 Tax=Clathrus columnatus TaxID=1419009 RepID=A0AAV5A1D9_9AGAM|nr:hypothetical protein Clacol_002277 [Clathrus columnatus]